ncbi:hypothetical protein Mapa_003449 [Marchantia paleacea]|nr:hypothetical protein Mapa_003449 [Marchantia paleacea]
MNQRFRPPPPLSLSSPLSLRPQQKNPPLPSLLPSSTSSFSSDPRPSNLHPIQHSLPNLPPRSQKTLDPSLSSPLTTNRAFSSALSLSLSLSLSPSLHSLLSISSSTLPLFLSLSLSLTSLCVPRPSLKAKGLLLCAHGMGWAAVCRRLPPRSPTLLCLSFPSLPFVLSFPSFTFLPSFLSFFLSFLLACFLPSFLPSKLLFSPLRCCQQSKHASLLSHGSSPSYLSGIQSTRSAPAA